MKGLIKLFLSFLFVFFGFCTKKGQETFEFITKYTEQYSQKFEANATSVHVEAISPIESKIISSYQGPRMNAYTSLFLLQNPKKTDQILIYSYQCSFDNECESDLNDFKIYDTKWNEEKGSILPRKELQEALLGRTQQLGIQKPIINVEKFPDEANRWILQFSISDSAEFNPTQGNTYFVFGYLVWNPEENRFNFLDEVIEPSP